MTDTHSSEVALVLPDTTRFPGPRPLVFMIPSSKMTDLQGNGSEYGVRDTLQDLSRELTSEGFASFRFALKERPLQLKEVLDHYEAVLKLQSIDPLQIFLLGVGDGSDSIARDFYRYWGFQRPLGAVLLSSSVHTIHLNNLTCPYLIVHGENDPTLRSEVPYSEVESAVHHHLGRYGDVTKNLCFPDLGRELGDTTLAQDVIEQVVKWVSKAQSTGFRKQEPAAKGAIPRGHAA